MNGKKINIALIGAGGIGSRWAKALKSVANVSLMFVVDKDLGKAQSLVAEYNQNCRATDNYADILKNEQVEAVIVALPHKFLAEVSTEFLSAGKHVLCEKPCGINVKEIKSLQKLAQKNNLRCMAGFNHRFHEGLILARKLFMEGRIGEIQFIRSVYGFGGRPEMQKEWRFDKKIAGGGELIDQGVHMIDLVCSFIGEIKDVKGITPNLYWKSEVEDNAFVLLQSKKNQAASLHVSWSNWKPEHRFEIFGTEGYIIVDGLGRKYGDGEKVILGLRGENYTDKPKEEVFVCNPDADMSLAREAEEFAKAIAEKRESMPNIDDALKTMEIVEKVYSNS